MRYISDLHIGKVNPKHFAFALDKESRKLRSGRVSQRPRGWRERCGRVLTQVEPPYPGYRRTMHALETYMELAENDDGEQLPLVKKAVAPGDAHPGVPRGCSG
jgi:hypothetical protein